MDQQDRTILGKKPLKVCIILCGPSGSGKSYKTRNLIELYKIIRAERIYVLSTDDYWYDGFGNYKFNHKELNKAHAWNLERFKTAISNKAEILIVDNTNLTIKDFSPYYTYASINGYELHIKLFCEKNIEKLYRNNQHGLSKEKIKEQINKLEILEKELLSGYYEQDNNRYRLSKM